MTKIVDGIHVLSYEEWKQKPEVAQELSSIDDCETCGGNGYHECECGDSHQCPDCFGNGKQQDFHIKYERLLKDELEKLLAWKNGDPLRRPSNSEMRETGSIYHRAIELNIQGE